MTDIFLFLHQGWRNIWKQNIIWLFSSLALLEQLLRNISVKQTAGLSWSFFLLVEKGGLLILSLISSVGVSYLAYSYSTGKHPTAKETLQAVKKFTPIIIVFGVLIFLMLSPLLCWAIYISIDNSTHTLQLAGKTLLAFLPFSIFSSMYDFTVFGFFGGDSLIPPSLKKAWILFTRHFGVLAVLGISFAVILRIFTALSGSMTVLLLSNFNIAALSSVDLLNPSASLGQNFLFILINGVFQTIYSPFSAAVFALAYTKYNDEKVRK